MMTDEQKKAIALARARRRRAEAQPAKDRGVGQVLYDNLVGDSTDGVTSYGESLGTWLNRAGESMTLGVVGDEASAAATGMLPGRSYDDELARYRQNEENMSGLGQFSADIAGAVVPGVAGVGLLSKAPTLGNAIMRGAGLGAAGGATQGFMEGEGNFGSRAANSAITGVLGAGIGAATPVLGELFQGAIRGGKEFLANRRIGAEAGRALGVKPGSGRVISEMLGIQDDEAMRAALDRAGPDAMLAEASPSMTGFLDTAVNAPGRASSVALPRVNEAVNSRMARATDALDYTMGLPSGMKGAQDAIRQGTAADRKRLYDAAFDTEIDWRAPGGEELRFELQNLPPSVASKARELQEFAPKPFQTKPDSAYLGDVGPDVRMASGPTADEAARLDGIDEAMRVGRQATRETGWKRPFTYFIATSGGIDPRGPAARELYKQGVTPQTTPGLFRLGGRMELDNLDIGSMPESLRFGWGDGSGFYASRQEIIDGIVGEMRGDAVRTASQGEAASLAADYADNAPRLRGEKSAIKREIAGRKSLPDAPAQVGDIVPTRTFRDVDTIKRAFDEVNRTNNGTGLMGGQSEIGRLAGERARRIRDLLAGMSDDYRKALETSSDTIRRVEAVKLGGQMLSPSMTREEVAIALDGMTAGEKTAMKQGLRQFIDDTVARVRAVPSDQNIDAREAMKSFALLSSNDARDKVTALLGESYSETVFKELDRLGSALGVRANIGANTRTAPRIAAGDFINEATDPGLLRRGRPVDAAKEALATSLGASEEAIRRMRADARADLADVLTRPGQAAQIMETLRNIGAENQVDPASGTALRRLFEAYMIGNSGNNATRIREALSRKSPLPQ